MHGLVIAVPTEAGIQRSDVSIVPAVMEEGLTPSFYIADFTQGVENTNVTIILNWSPANSAVNVFYIVLKGFAYIVTYNYTKTA